MYFFSDIEIVEVNDESSSKMEKTGTNLSPDSTVEEEEEPPKDTVNIQPFSSALRLNHSSALSQEDPVKMMDSILNESETISQNISLLGK